MLKPVEAKLELAILDSQAISLDRVDVLARFTNAGLPQEIVQRLNELWDVTKIVGGKLIQIGKIVILSIIKFIEKNPNLAIGIAVGAAIGALVSLIPFIGVFLAPLTAAIGATIGAIAGANLDQGHRSNDQVISIAQDIVLLAKKFFEFLAEIFNAFKNEFSEN